MPLHLIARLEYRGRLRIASTRQGSAKVTCSESAPHIQDSDVRKSCKIVVSSLNPSRKDEPHQTQAHSATEIRPGSEHPSGHSILSQYQHGNDLFLSLCRLSSLLVLDWCSLQLPWNLFGMYAALEQSLRPQSSLGIQLVRLPSLWQHRKWICLHMLIA